MIDSNFYGFYGVNGPAHSKTFIKGCDVENCVLLEISFFFMVLLDLANFLRDFQTSPVLYLLSYCIFQWFCRT